MPRLLPSALPKSRLTAAVATKCCKLYPFPILCKGLTLENNEELQSPSIEKSEKVKVLNKHCLFFIYKIAFIPNFMKILDHIICVSDKHAIRQMYVCISWLKCFCFAPSLFLVNISCRILVLPFIRRFTVADVTSRPRDLVRFTIGRIRIHYNTSFSLSKILGNNSCQPNGRK